jgi:mannose/fructose/N-acetylgalactosamine-specific phosphotransferase system component IIB
MIILTRIDDRLVHAQVVVGWGRELRPGRIVVADDRVASSEWERDLYASAAPPEIRVSILSVGEAYERISAGEFDGERTILLVRGPAEIIRLLDMGLEIGEVNVGGMHYSDGKVKVLDNVYLDDDGRKALGELARRGITLEARALPRQEKVILNPMVS